LHFSAEVSYYSPYKAKLNVVISSYSPELKTAHIRFVASGAPTKRPGRNWLIKKGKSSGKIRIWRWAEFCRSDLVLVKDRTGLGRHSLTE
jgi:hypothetical protein